MEPKLNWLDEVKADAEFNCKKRIREYEERKAHEESKKVLAMEKALAQSKAKVEAPKKGK